MSFTNQKYAGDSNGENVLLVMKKTPIGADFIRMTKTNETTTEYVASGGDTFATAAELTQFKANRSYLAYAQRDIVSSNVKTTTSGLFTNSGSGKTGNGSGDVNLGPDPRISHRATFPSGTTHGIGASAGICISHMQQIVITDTNSSTTFDCYFGRFFDGFTGATASMEVMLVGATNNSITGGFDRFDGPFIFETPTGSTSECVKTSIKNLKNVNNFREMMKDQIGKSLDSATFDSITYGTARDKSVVFFRGSTDLNELATISTLVQANLRGETAENIANVHLPFVGVSSATSDLVGVTFNAQTGGCGAASEFDDAVSLLFKSRFTTQTTLNSTLRTFESITTIRELTNTAF